ncbi:MAG: tyrosine-protein phosphatase [Bacteroidota bacterium]
MALSHHFVQIFGAGRLALSERPKVKEIPQLVTAGCNQVVFILAPTDKPQGIGRAVEASGLVWHWLQVGHATELTSIEKSHFRMTVRTIYEQVLKGESVLLHCSAGLHRTGMFAYALLLRGGLSHEEAMGLLGELRRETQVAMEEKYLQVAKEMH